MNPWKSLVFWVCLAGCATAPAKPPPGVPPPAAPPTPSATLAAEPVDLPAAPPAAGADDLVTWRGKQLVEAFTAAPRWPADLFAGSWSKAEREDVRGLVARLYGKHGALKSLAVVERRSPHSALLEATFEKDVIIPMSLSVEDKPPHGIAGLWFRPAQPALASLEQVVGAFSKLPGKASFALCRLENGRAQTVLSHHPDESLALGSTFKLYILGALLEDVRQGKRRWQDVVLLDGSHKSLPSGRLQLWPVGAPVTLHTLASSMISESDNTATDHLLFALGRERVEKMLVPMGNSAPERNRPFLSTAEAFRLKNIDGGRAGQSYLAKSEADRRAFLETEVAKLPLDRAEDHTDPRMTDTIEWFASTSSLCRAMESLRAATEAGPAAAGRLVLAINPGFKSATKEFAYVAYKGGSEPGVANQSFLLQTKNGKWWALSATWNNTAALDDERFFPVVERALVLLGRSEVPK